MHWKNQGEEVLRLNENKLIFKVYGKEPIIGDMLRLTAKTRDSINQIKRETGLSASRIVEKCLEFAVENYEVEEV